FPPGLATLQPKFQETPFHLYPPGFEENVVTTKRPVNLDIGTIALPITAYASILHRVSGVILFAVAGLLLWLLDTSLSSEQGFASVRECLDSTLAKLVLWAA